MIKFKNPSIYYPLTLAFALFFSAISFAFAQTTCGDIFYQEYGYGESGEGWVELSTPIEDCDNPFNADDPQPFNFSLTVLGEEVSAGETIQIEENQSVTGQYVIGKPFGVEAQNFAWPQFVLYQATGTDYRQITRSDNGETFSADNLSPGEYVAVFLFREPPILSQSCSWWQCPLKALFGTEALAFYPNYVYVATLNFNIEHVPTEPAGASSVLFLPGLKSSRLYTENILGVENRLWEPNVNLDVAKLAMTENSESINDIYTRDILSEVFGVIDIYNGFTRYLDGLISDNVIEDWKPFAYDWRYDVLSIVEDGTIYKSQVDSELQRVYPTEVIESLAATSRTGKVTIVAHSNGGLLAKALMIKLESEGKSGLVDNIIFVGSPQLGTPEAIASILHGYDQALLGGLLVGDTTAREASLNMPGAYGLLPSAAYVAATNKPLIQFDGSATTELFRNQYGNAINTTDELSDFMVGTEGRSDAVTIYDAIIANSRLVQEASNYHDNLLDNWVAPSGVGITEIVGVGLDTEDGFNYEEITKRVCSEPDAFGSRTCENEVSYRQIPQMTLFGDGTVVGNSAEGYANDKSTYYLDLKLIKSDLRKTIKHSNLTEFSSVLDLIKNVLTNSNEVTPFLSTQKPDIDSERTMLGVHSPVSLTVEDDQGNTVGLSNNELIEEIPGSSYREIGSSKYIIVPKGVEYDVILKGEDEGGMTLTIHDLEGDNQSEVLKLPIEIITASTSITFSNTGESFTNILIDTNGDGTVDTEVTPEGIVVEDEVEEVVTYQSLYEAIDELSLKRIYKKSLVRSAKLAEKISNKSNKPIFKHIEKLLLKKLQKQLRFYERKRIISREEYQKLTEILQELSN